MTNPDEPPYVASGRPEAWPEDERSRWAAPLPRTVPAATFWPAVMALAVAAGFWGIVLDRIVVGAAAVLFAVACAGWIGDMLHE